MKNNVKCLLAFTFGAAVGVAASWKYMELKYKQIADAEIESVKELYSSKPVEEDIEEADEEEPVVEEPKKEESKDDERVAYNQILKSTGYHNNYSTISKEGEASNDSIDTPYIIDETELGELDYEVINLTYYEGDNTLADDLDELVDDVDSAVGWANLDKFGEYDSICVRNDARRVDFEILLDIRSFADVTYLRNLE